MQETRSASNWHLKLHPHNVPPGELVQLAREVRDEQAATPAGTPVSSLASRIASDPSIRILIKSKAAQLCRRSDFSRSDRDDLSQAMSLHLLQKAHLFDPGRGSLEAFVTQAIKKWIKIELRSRGRLKRRGDYATVSLSTEVEHAGETDSLASLLDEDDRQRRMKRSRRTAEEMVNLRDAIQHVMGSLSPEQRELLQQVSQHGVSPTARDRGVSRRQIENALKIIRCRFEDAGLGDE